MNKGNGRGQLNLQSSSVNDGISHQKNRILLVDDDDELLEITQRGLERRGFEVVAASSVNDALGHISSKHFDVLLSDLHMPNCGDGLTVVSAMRHKHPKALTLLLSGFPDIQEAVNAIREQADEVLIKPISANKISEIINQRLAHPGDHSSKIKESVAVILMRDATLIIEDWLSRLKSVEELISLPLTTLDRTGHLPRLLADLALRFQGIPGGQPRQISIAAREHGCLRRIQGYTIAMIVEESRLLQVSIFNGLQNNLAAVNFDTILLDVMTIADEVDAQLKEAVLGFAEACVPQEKPGAALNPSLTGIDRKEQKSALLAD